MVSWWIEWHINGDVCRRMVIVCKLIMCLKPFLLFCVISKARTNLFYVIYSISDAFILETKHTWFNLVFTNANFFNILIKSIIEVKGWLKHV